MLCCFLVTGILFSFCISLVTQKCCVTTHVHFNQDLKLLPSNAVATCQTAYPGSKTVKRKHGQTRGKGKRGSVWEGQTLRHFSFFLCRLCSRSPAFSSSWRRARIGLHDKNNGGGRGGNVL